MRNPIVCVLFYFSLTIIFLVSCKKDTDVSVPDQSFVEEFDDIKAAMDSGWVFLNKSIPVDNNSTQWQEGSVSSSITAYSPKGSTTGFISTNYAATSSGEGIISNWAVSPHVIMQNGDKIIFYTRGLAYPERDFYRDFINRLQLRANVQNDSADVGNGASVGSFETLLLDINANYDEYSSDPDQEVPTAYPPEWTRFEATISGLAAPVNGRFAFRYFLEGGGSDGRGSEVAIDSVAYVGINQ